MLFQGTAGRKEKRSQSAPNGAFKEKYSNAMIFGLFKFGLYFDVSIIKINLDLGVGAARVSVGLGLESIASSASETSIIKKIKSEKQEKEIK